MNKILVIDDFDQHGGQIGLESRAAKASLPGLLCLSSSRKTVKKKPTYPFNKSALSCALVCLALPKK
ncbi:MAG: hypothetical protein DYG89_14770 [Caldilinea sp. CFX5]|nr:hypothetical protein [Caldilinea sp. CFX5]